MSEFVSDSPAKPSRAWTIAACCVALAIIAAAAWSAHAIALRSGLQRVTEAAQARLDVVAARLDGELARFEYLPSLLETSPDVLQLLDAPADAALRDKVSRYLQVLNATAGADSLYVLDRSGVAVAAADQGQPGTPIGEDLSYRPYMRDALVHGHGRFYGVGITSGRAGYYLSYALPKRGEARGVATVKVNLEAGEREWRDLPGDVLVADEREVVILASRPEWKYHPLRELSPTEREEAAQARRYGNAELVPLDWRTYERFGDRATRIGIGSQAYLATERRVNRDHWRLIVVNDEAPQHAAARIAAISGALAAAVLVLAMMVIIQRQRAVRQQLANREALQAAHDSLEAKVQERTAELRAAQNELVHAGKLGVLGQMSAGMVHELNQPLAALRTLSDNAVVLIEKGRLDEARGNMGRIGNLVDRLGRLTHQLKVFAHKSSEPVVPVGVRKVVNDALFIVGTRIRERGIVVAARVEPEDLAVCAEATRLEQVLVNLLGNAIDALGRDGMQRIEIAAAAHGEQCAIVVSNTGPGIDPEVLPRLFEPFVTTKPAGKGLGLGLMISAHIVHGFGGSLKARNLAPAGAEFTIELPRAAVSRRGAHE